MTCKNSRPLAAIGDNGSLRRSQLLFKLTEGGGREVATPVLTTFNAEEKVVCSL